MHKQLWISVRISTTAKELSEKEKHKVSLLIMAIEHKTDLLVIKSSDTHTKKIASLLRNQLQSIQSVLLPSKFA